MSSSNEIISEESVAQFLFVQMFQIHLAKKCTSSILAEIDVDCVSVDVPIQILHVNMEYYILTFEM